MNDKTLMTIITIILPLLGAGIGFLIKSSIEKKKELTNEINKERRELYQQYVNLIVDLFSKNKINNPKKMPDMLTELFGFYKKYILYASPNVIIAFSDYFQYMYKQNESDDMNSKLHLSYMTKVMYEMRKDIGLKNDNLGNNGEYLLRAIITDFDEIIQSSN